MGAQLNIKSEDAYRLASRLSELTGESLTTVVTRALRAELDREERTQDRQERLLSACARQPPNPPTPAAAGQFQP